MQAVAEAVEPSTRTIEVVDNGRIITLEVPTNETIRKVVAEIEALENHSQWVGRVEGWVAILQSYDLAAGQRRLALNIGGNYWRATAVWQHRSQNFPNIEERTVSVEVHLGALSQSLPPVSMPTPRDDAATVAERERAERKARERNVELAAEAKARERDAELQAMAAVNAKQLDREAKDVSEWLRAPSESA